MGSEDKVDGVIRSQLCLKCLTAGLISLEVADLSKTVTFVSTTNVGERQWSAQETRGECDEKTVVTGADEVHREPRDPAPHSHNTPPTPPTPTPQTKRIKRQAFLFFMLSEVRHRLVWFRLAKGGQRNVRHLNRESGTGEGKQKRHTVQGKIIVECITYQESIRLRMIGSEFQLGTMFFFDVIVSIGFR